VDVLRAVGTALVAAGGALGTMLLGVLLTDLPGWSVPVAVAITLVYGITAGILGSYDLRSPGAWLLLVLDHTWSLPNTLLGTVVGTLLYPWFGTPSRALSAGHDWVAMRARSTTGFGADVLQTVGPVNLGGPGAHERVHLLQARIFGPTFVPLVIASYLVTGVIQVLSIPVCLVLRALGITSSWHLQPPASSAVSGFFGWIYYATPFELWAYATQ